MFDSAIKEALHIYSNVPIKAFATKTTQTWLVFDPEPKFEAPFSFKALMSLVILAKVDRSQSIKFLLLRIAL